MTVNVSLKKTAGTERKDEHVTGCSGVPIGGQLRLHERAEWRCDCATIVDACSATVTVEGGGVSIEATIASARASTT
jgi:hypothetical protein